jgi:hypothetical protein
MIISWAALLLKSIFNIAKWVRTRGEQKVPGWAVGEGWRHSPAMSSYIYSDDQLQDGVSKSSLPNIFYLKITGNLICLTNKICSVIF